MIEVVKSVDISVHQSESAAIIGSSGSGKSTLLNIMGGLDRPDAGQIYWNRSSINDWTSDKLAEERNRQVGFIFQFHHLLPEFNALENVYLPRSEEHTSELQSRGHLVCRLLLEKKK